MARGKTPNEYSAVTVWPESRGSRGIVQAVLAKTNKHRQTDGRTNKQTYAHSME